jgi:hypothetical protein
MAGGSAMAELCVILLLLAEEAPPGALVLLAGDERYQKAKEPAATLDGVLERTPSVGRLDSASRFNVYRLRYQDSGKERFRELYVPGKAYLLAGHLGKKVRVHGKAIDTKADGKVHAELWPAWVLPLTGELARAPAADGVFVRCDWQPEEARRRGTRTYVIRSGEQLARLLRVRGGSANETATEMLAQKLRVPAIDWERHMLVCVSAGLQGPSFEGLVITGVAQRDGGLRVGYRLVPPQGGGAGFAYPAQTALVKRFDGAVRFEQEAAPKPDPEKKR